MLSENGRICVHLKILNLNKAIRKTWLNILTTEASLYTQVKTPLDNSPENYFEHMSNKQIRNTFKWDFLTWKINNSPYCHCCCKEVETMVHVISNCKYLAICWLRVNNTFKFCGISKQVRTLQYIVISYKTELLDYYGVTYCWTNLDLLYINHIFALTDELNCVIYLNYWHTN